MVTGRPAIAWTDLAIGLELLVLVGQVVAVQEQELAAEEADAHRADLERLLDVLGQLDVRLQLDRDAFERGRGRRLQALQLLPLELELALAELVLGEHLPVGVDDQHPGRAVDDEQLALADHLPGVVQADDRREVEAARDDRGVRGDAADVGDEAGELVLLEEDHVRRREVVRDDDDVLLVLRRLGQVPGAEHPLQHALDHLLHVGLALAQVGVLDLLEPVDEDLHLVHQRPLGVPAARADQLARRDREHRVVEDHQVQVEKGAHLGRRVGGHRRVQADQLAADLLDRGVEAHDLGVDVLARDLVVRDLEPRARDEVGVADRDAARHAGAVQREARAGLLAERGFHRRDFRLAHRPPPPPSLSFAELVFHQLRHRVERRVGVRAGGFDPDPAALAGGEHHHAHDALRVHAPAVPRQPHVGAELGRDLRHLGRRARVQAELVLDLNLALRHALAPRCITPSRPPLIALSTTAASGCAR